MAARDEQIAALNDVTMAGAVAFAMLKQKASEQKVQNDDVALSLFSINVQVPQAVLLLILSLTPLFFALSVALLRMLQLRQRLCAIQLARVEARLAALIGAEFVGCSVDPEVTTPRVEWDYMKSREWGKLFQNDPELFADVFFGAANVALVTILVFIVVHVATGLHNYPKIFILVSSVVAGIAIEVLSRKVASAALGHGLQEATATAPASVRGSN